jgi:predicted DNA-binding transcriptional regulator AlpA
MNEWLKDSEVAQRVACTKNHVWRRAKNEPEFPKPVSLGPKCTRWKGEDVEAFIEMRSSESWEKPS